MFTLCVVAIKMLQLRVSDHVAKVTVNKPLTELTLTSFILPPLRCVLGLRQTFACNLWRLGPLKI